MTKVVEQDFFYEWSIYDQILDHDYMFHEKIYHDVHSFLADRYEKRPFTLLDLGCGSARHLAQALQGCSVSRYVGYDLSDVALAHAMRNLAALGCPTVFRQGDLLEALRAGGEPFDLIFSSFALHHLISADKAVFFQLAHQRLTENGMLLLIDVTREKDEDSRLYLDHYCSWLRSDWRALLPEALDTVCDHIRNNDFPETAAELHAMATQAGFSGSVDMNRFRWHQTWCFEKRRAQPPLLPATGRTP